MIKIDKWNIQITGITPVIRAEVSTLIRALYQEEALTKEEIREDVEMGLMSDKELNKQFNEKMDKFFEKLKSKMED